MEVYVVRLTEIGEPNILRGFLSPTDMVEIAKVSNRKAQRQKLAALALMRSILSQKLNLEPQNICIYKNNYGKPYIKHGSVFFNVSHSGDLIVFAIDDGEVGIDIEFMKPRDFENIAVNVFEKEIADMIIMAENKKQVFYQCWTRHEALVKLKGCSFFDTFDVQNMFTNTVCLEDYILTIASYKKIPSNFSIVFYRFT